MIIDKVYKNNATDEVKGFSPLQVLRLENAGYTEMTEQELKDFQESVSTSSGVTGGVVMVDAAKLYLVEIGKYQALVDWIESKNLLNDPLNYEFNCTFEDLSLAGEISKPTLNTSVEYDPDIDFDDLKAMYNPVASEEANIDALNTANLALVNWLKSNTYSWSYDAWGEDEEPNYEFEATIPEGEITLSCVRTNLPGSGTPVDNSEYYKYHIKFNDSVFWASNDQLVINMLEAIGEDPEEFFETVNELD